MGRGEEGDRASNGTGDICMIMTKCCVSSGSRVQSSLNEFPTHITQNICFLDGHKKKAS